MPGANRPLLAAALNGARTAEEHPHIPRTPSDLARAARAAADAGARVLHIHAYDDAGRETLEAEACAAAVRAVRSVCPRVPISLTTAAYIEPDALRRLNLVHGWTELPDLVTANQGEDGIRELCEHLLERGVGIEAGLLSVADAEAFVESGLAPWCARLLVEPLDPDPVAAVRTAAAIEDVVVAIDIQLEQVHHGDQVASWAVNEHALKRGHGIRTGLEDTTVLPDGRLAADNAELVRAAVKLIEATTRFPRRGI